MSIAHAIILGVIQGLTEFLPVSSDGHLVVADLLLGVQLSGNNALGFDILLHGGSLLALLLIERALWFRILSSPFRGDRGGLRLLFLLIVSVIPAAVIGILFEDLIAGELRAIEYAAAGFCATAVVLIAGEHIGRKGRSGMESISLWQTILIGCAQAIALLPGVSRSGMTISAGRALGLSREAALRFSFLMVVPAIGGALAKTVWDAWAGQVTFPPLLPSAIGFAASFAVSAAAILFLRRFVARFSLSWFAWYLFPLAAYLLFEAWHIRAYLDLPHIETYVKTYGGIAVFLFALAESIPPLGLVSPGIFALIIAGSLAADMETVLFFIVTATAGVSIGNFVLYLLGRYYGRDIAHRIRLTEERLRKVDEAMRRFGKLAVVIGQFIGAVRPFIAFVAGTSRMSPAVYLLFMLPAAIAWGGYNVLIGYAAGTNVVIVLSVVWLAGYLIPAVIALLVGIGSWFAKRKK